MLRLQSKAPQLRHVARMQMSEVVAGLKPSPGFRLPLGACKYATSTSTQTKESAEGSIKKLLVANRGIHIGSTHYHPTKF